MKEIMLAIVLAIVILGSFAIFRSCEVDTAKLVCQAAVAQGESVGNYDDSCKISKL